MLIHHDSVIIQQKSQFLSQIAALGAAQRHKEASHGKGGAVGEADLLQGGFPSQALNGPHIHLQPFGEGNQGLRAVGEQGDAAGQREQLLGLVESVLAVSQHSHVFAPIEESVADGAVADPLAFQLFEPRDGGTLSGRAGGQQQGAGLQSLSGGGDLVTSVPGNANHFLLQKNGAQLRRLLFPVFHQGVAILRNGKTKVIFYFFRFGEGAVVLSDDGHGKAGPKKIESGREPGGPVADNYHILHMCYLLER